MEAHRRILADADSWLASRGFALDFKRHEKEFPWSKDQASQERRARALAEVDGLKAGLHYLDIVEELSGSQSPGLSSQPPSSQSFDRPTPLIGTEGGHHKAYSAEIDVESDGHLRQAPSELKNKRHLQPRQELKNPAPSSIEPGRADIPRKEPNESQWEALKMVQAATERQHRDMDFLADKTGSDVIMKLQQDFKSARILREAGIQVFKDVLGGHDPIKLNEVFAFTNLSYSISKLLFENGRIEKEEILSGIRIWREAIPTVEEKTAFDLLAKELWPEAAHHLSPEHERELRNGQRPGQDIPQSRPDSSHRHNTSASPGVAHGPASGSSGMRSSVRGLVAATLDFGLLGSELTGVPNGFGIYTPYQSFEEPIMYMHGHTWDQFLFSELQPQYNIHGVPFPMAMPGPSNQQPGTISSQDDENDADSDSETKDPDLSRTVMFLIVFAWIKELQNLLFILSGNGITVEDPRSGQAQSEPEKTKLHDFFESRSQHDCPSPDFQALLRVANELAQDGLLRSTTQVQDYLINVAKEIISSSKLYPGFNRWVLEGTPPITRTPAAASSPQLKRKRTPSSETDDGLGSKQQRFTCQHQNYDGTECGMQFKTRPGLSKHKKKHEVSVELHCPMRDYSNSRRDLLRKHFKNMHPELPVPPFIENKGRGASVAY